MAATINASADGSPVAAVEGEQSQERRHDRPHQRPGRPQGDRPRGEHQGRPRHGKGEAGKGDSGKRDFGKRDFGKGGRDRDGRDRGDRRDKRPMFVSSAPPRREKVADPNSPFAKLAALKQQLEDAKEK